jgi:hypothetical protein
MALPALVLVDDQMPITDAPSDAHSRVSGSPLARKRKNATVAKKSG